MRPGELLIWLMLACFNAFAQPAKFTFIEDADALFKQQNFLSAIPIYKTELKKEPDNIKIKYRLGLCYLNTKLNRDDAVTFLEEASKHEDTEADVWLHLGRAYHLNNRIDDAVVSFEKFAGLKPKRADEVDHYLEQCENAKRFMKKPQNVTFLNMGKEINSADPDYYPFIDKDEMTLVFTTRRKENFGGKKIEVDGYRSSDIYQSFNNNGQWTEAKNVGRTVNGNLDEQIVGLRSDGLEMYVYLDHIDKYGDLYVSRRKDFATEFSKPKVFDQAINSDIETSGCMSEDGNIIIFARRDKINDNSDLFLARKLPNGKWGIPQQLPDVINTPYNEDMPYLSFDGKTLFFASEGHNSMGGYDLFKTNWDQEVNTFSQPVNLGYPINSTDDDRSICVTRDNRLAYVSAFRPTGFGDLDIYRIRFEDQEQVSVIYTGEIFLGDTSQKASVKNYDVKITVTDTKTDYEYMFVPHPKTGRYVMALPAGTYKLVTHARGYARHKEQLLVSDMGQVNLERRKNLYLRKLNAR